MKGWGGRKRSRAFGNRRVSRNKLTSIRGWGVSYTGRAIGRPLAWAESKAGFQKGEARTWVETPSLGLQMLLWNVSGSRRRERLTRGWEPELQSRGNRPHILMPPKFNFSLLPSLPGRRHFILCLFWSVLKFTRSAPEYWPFKNYCFCWKHICPPSHFFEVAFSSVPQI